MKFSKRVFRIKWIAAAQKIQALAVHLYKYLKYVYLVMAILFIADTAYITPVFQVPDETNHFARAEQVSRGIFVANFISNLPMGKHLTTIDGKYIYPDLGGYVSNSGISQLDSINQGIKFYPDHKLTLALIQSSKKISWNLLSQLKSKMTGMPKALKQRWKIISVMKKLMSYTKMN